MQLFDYYSGVIESIVCLLEIATSVEQEGRDKTKNWGVAPGTAQGTPATGWQNSTKADAPFGAWRKALLLSDTRAGRPDSG